MAEAEDIVKPMIDFVDKDKPKSSSMPSNRSTKPADQKLVAVLMGSDSDLPVVSEGFPIFEKFSIPYSAHIKSAHRTPNAMAEFATSAASKGYKCIIAAAGESA
jgi:phosphoribosylaminoimidazole carboxylase